MSLNNDFVLMENLKSGNYDSVNFLMDKYYKSLCGYATILTNDSNKSEDIVQNVFIKIWVNKNKINSNISIKSYLYKSVYNEFIDEYRKNKAFISIENKHLEIIEHIVEKNSDVYSENLIKKVNDEIEKLPVKCRKIFLLNKKEGLTHTEIATHLKISIKTVEGHITRAFKALNKKLGDKVETLLFLIFDFKK